MRRLRTSVYVCAVLAVLAVALLLHALPGRRVSVGVAVEFNDHAAAAWVALSKGWFRSAGLSVSALATFKTGLELAAALGRGDIDAAWVCLGPALMAYSRGVPIKVISMTHLNGYAIVGRPEHRGVRDLDGRVVACAGPGSPAWLLVRMAEDMYGFRVRVRVMPPHIALNALLTGQVDAASLPEHFATLAELRGMKAFLRSRDLWPNMPGSVLVVKESLIRSDPSTVYKLVMVNARATKYIVNNLEDSARVVARELDIPYEAALRSMKQLNYTCTIDVREVQRYIDLMVKYGAIEGELNASSVVYDGFLRRVGC